MNIDSRLIKSDSLLRQVVSLTWTSLPEERRSGRRTPERSAPHACAVHRQLLRRSARVRSVASARGGARPQIRTRTCATAMPMPASRGVRKRTRNFGVSSRRGTRSTSWLRSSPGPLTAYEPGSSGCSCSNPGRRTPRRANPKGRPGIRAGRGKFVV